MSKLAVAVSAVLVLAPTAAAQSPLRPAQPGAYLIHVCADPVTGLGYGDKGLPDGWSAEIASDTVTVDCAGPIAYDKGLAIGSFSQDPLNPSRRAQLAFTAPQDTSIARAELYRHAHTDHWGVSLTGYLRLVGGQEPQLKDESGHTESCYPQLSNPRCTELGDGPPTPVFSPGNRVLFTAGEPVRAMTFGYVVGGCSDCSVGGWEYRILGGAIELRDLYPPTFAEPPAGELFRPGATLRGVVEANVLGRDRGGGLRSVELLVDGKPARIFGFGCTEPFLVPQPCPPASQVKVELDTTGLPDGQHFVEARLADATGTNSASFGPVPVVVDNVADRPDRGPLNGRGASDGARLTGGLGRRRRGSVRIRQGRRTSFVGRLTDADGRPIAEADVRMLTRLAIEGSGFVDHGAVRTDAGGRFSTSVPAGPSRTLRFGYRSRLADTEFAAVADYSIRVPARVTLIVRRKRVPVRGTAVFTGRVIGTPLPSAGKLVELQARERGHWRTFATPRTGRTGRFSASYRFGRGARRVTFPIRVRVRRDGSYPYEEGYSRVVRVRVG